MRTIPLCLFLPVLMVSELFAGTVTNKNDSGAGSLRQVFASAANGETITFASNVTGTIALTTGQLTVDKTLKIQGPGASVLTITSNQAIFATDFGPPADLTLSGLTLANASNGAVSFGVRGTLTISNCVVTGNDIDDGGAINLDSGADLQLTNSTVSGNTHAGVFVDSGAGLGNISGCTISGNSTGIASATDQTVSVVDSTIANNTSYGIFARGEGALRVLRTTLTGNNKGIGSEGVVTLANSSIANSTSLGITNGAFGTVKINHSTISNNGGGILSEGVLTIVDSSFTGNSTQADGGAINSSDTHGIVTVNRTTFSNNTADLGGAIYADVDTQMSFVNCTFSGNTARFGGAIDNHTGDNSGKVSLTNCTIFNNTATDGRTFNGKPFASGGVYNEAAITVKNTIIAGNMGPGATKDVSGVPDPNFPRPYTSQGYNLIGRSDGSIGFTNGTNHDQVGSDASPIDPKLGAIGDNGGPTQTHLPLTGSRAIDQGSADSNATMDQRGYTRPFEDSSVANVSGGNGSDIGAVEAGSSPPPPPPGRSLNLSTRAHVMAQNEIAIGGFIITGNQPRQILMRGIGFSLPNYIQGKLDNAALVLTNTSGQQIAASNDWQIESQADAIRATGIPPGYLNDAAILMTLAPGSYGVQLSGQNSSTGIGLVEIFDLSDDLGSRLANMSTRALVGTGDDVMIGGLILGGGGSSAIVIDARGPSVQIANGKLADPTLELRDGNGTLVATNDDWQSDPNHSQIPTNISSTYDNKDSALYRMLAPGAYSAIVRGKGSATGIALVEIFNIPPG